MCASWEAGTKESITCGCQSERTGEGEVKNTSNCCRRIEETPARCSLKAAQLHAWSRLTPLSERQYSLSGDCKETETGYLTVVTHLAVNTLNAYGKTIGEGRESN